MIPFQSVDQGERIQLAVSMPWIHRIGQNWAVSPSRVMFCVEGVITNPPHWPGERSHAAKTPWFHPDRAAGGDRHHRRPDRPALARRAGGARGGPPGSAPTISSRWAWASHNYMSQQNAMPPLFTNWGPTYSAAPAVGGDSRGHWPLGWAVSLLPFIEQTALYNSANYSFGSPDPTNFNTLTALKVNAYICPSESQRNGPVWGSTFMNYKANIGGPAQIMSVERADRCHAYGWPGWSLAHENFENVGWSRVRVDHGRDQQFGRLQREAGRDQRRRQRPDK